MQSKHKSLQQFRTSIKNKFRKNEDEKLMTNPFYSKQVENMMHEEIEIITIQYNIKQQEQKLEQLEIEYLLYNTSIKQCIIKIRKNFESMKN